MNEVHLKKKISREKSYMGRNVTGKNFNWEKCYRGRNVTGRNVTGRIVTGRNVSGRNVIHPSRDLCSDFLENLESSCEVLEHVKKSVLLIIGNNFSEDCERLYSLNMFGNN